MNWRMCILIAGLGLIGCSVEPTTPSTPNEDTIASEPALQRAIRAAINQDFADDSATIEIAVQDDAASVGGTVQSVEQRARVEALIWEFDDIERVQSTLTTPGGADEADADLSARVQIMLESLGDADISRVSAASENGVVYLWGVVQSPSDLTTIAETASTIEDVARVISYLHVRGPIPPLNDRDAAPALRNGERLVLPLLEESVVARNAERLAWPLEGSIVSRFDPGRSDGIEIAGNEGESVRAAAAGEIVYAGSDLAMYGVLILVRHANGLVTAYGYLARAEVREGDRVAAGQNLGALGARSNGSPRLLFQVRQGQDARDPELFLPPR